MLRIQLRLYRCIYAYGAFFLFIFFVCSFFFARFALVSVGALRSTSPTSSLMRRADRRQDLARTDIGTKQGASTRGDPDVGEGRERRGSVGMILVGSSSFTSEVCVEYLVATRVYVRFDTETLSSFEWRRSYRCAGPDIWGSDMWPCNIVNLCFRFKPINVRGIHLLELAFHRKRSVLESRMTR